MAIGPGETTKSSDMNEVSPVGAVLPYAGSTAPTGWLLCYGQVLDATSNTDYQGLFNIIGNVFGGSDNTDFEVPDMRGNMPLGKDNMGGVSRDRVTNAAADTVGDEEGEETHQLTIGELATHAHTRPIPNNNYADSGSGSGGTASANLGYAVKSDTGSVGSDTAHNNMTPYITLNYIIRYKAYA